jgi:hypothetical protein
LVPDYFVPYKECPKCHVVKYLNEFNTNGRCKACNRAYQTARREKIKREIRWSNVMLDQVHPSEMTEEEYEAWAKMKREVSVLEGTDDTPVRPDPAFTVKRIPGFHMSDEEIRQLQEETEGE